MFYNTLLLIPHHCFSSFFRSFPFPSRTFAAEHVGAIVTVTGMIFVLVSANCMDGSGRLVTRPAFVHCWQRAGGWRSRMEEYGRGEGGEVALPAKLRAWGEHCGMSRGTEAHSHRHLRVWYERCLNLKAGVKFRTDTPQLTRSNICLCVLVNVFSSQTMWTIKCNSNFFPHFAEDQTADNLKNRHESHLLKYSRFLFAFFRNAAIFLAFASYQD